VLEVGANVGQFGTALRVDGYSGTILSFESASGAGRLRTEDGSLVDYCRVTAPGV
jgi:hypothetical protein